MILVGIFSAINCSAAAVIHQNILFLVEHAGAVPVFAETRLRRAGWRRRSAAVLIQRYAVRLKSASG